MLDEDFWLIGNFHPSNSLIPSLIHLGTGVSGDANTSVPCEPKYGHPVATAAEGGACESQVLSMEIQAKGTACKRMGQE